jgi:hypothetical protein
LWIVYILNKQSSVGFERALHGFHYIVVNGTISPLATQYLCLIQNTQSNVKVLMKCNRGSLYRRFNCSTHKTITNFVFRMIVCKLLRRKKRRFFCGSVLISEW